MSEPPVQPPGFKAPSRGRMRFLHDVAVFQGKLLLDNVRNLTLVALSHVAVLLDLTSKDAVDGKKFCAVLRWGQTCQQ